LAPRGPVNGCSAHPASCRGEKAGWSAAAASCHLVWIGMMARNRPCNLVTELSLSSVCVSREKEFCKRPPSTNC
jgi:hypothetical protein